MQAFKSSVFYAFLTLWTIICFVAGAPLFLTFHSRTIRLIGHYWAWGILRALKIICNLDFKIKGEEHLPKGAYIIASKHQSMWETVFLTAYIPEAVFILKKELTQIPLYGWYLQIVGMISIDRKAGFDAIKKVVKAAQQSLAAGKVIIIFPEGTRTLVGKSRPYNPGIAAIHQRCPEIPIVPMALNSGCFWGKGLSVIAPGCVEVEFLAAHKSQMERKELLSKLQKEIDLKSNILAK